MSTVTPQDLLACCREAAIRAGSHALANRHRRRETHQVAKHDVKLVLDIECQAVAEGVIAAHYPAHELLGEEGDGTVTGSSDRIGTLLHDSFDARANDPAPGSGDYLWVIDPIDGTVNFSHGLREWCCSVAVCRGSRVVAGCVYAPALDELYTASLDQPTQLNDEPAHVSDMARLEESIVLTGIDRHGDNGLAPYAVLTALADVVQRPRVKGAAAVDICHVACGRADGYVETSIFVWDVAAAGFIAQQAGARSEMTTYHGGMRLQLMVTNRLLHEPLRQVVSSAGT